jgi:hypothetical protein
VIRSLLITILVEGIVVYVYAALTKKPAGNLLLASFIVNVFTQSILWIALGIFFRYYLIALFTAEVLIWMAESLMMHRLSIGQLTMREAIFISLFMNFASFGVGWLLPI